ncbi:MAG: hypothetical protein WAO29_04515, partial [Candidatus Nanopelagicales bacterium]
MAISKNKQIGTGAAIVIVISIIFSLGDDSSSNTASIDENNSAQTTQVQPTPTPQEPSVEPDPSSTETSQEPTPPNSFDALIAQLNVEPEFIGGYDRSLFRHWVDDSGNG